MSIISKSRRRQNASASSTCPHSTARIRNSTYKTISSLGYFVQSKTSCLQEEKKVIWPTVSSKEENKTETFLIKGQSSIPYHQLIFKSEMEKRKNNISMQQNKCWNLDLELSLECNGLRNTK